MMYAMHRVQYIRQLFCTYSVSTINALVLLAPSTISCIHMINYFPFIFIQNMKIACIYNSV